MSFLDNIKSSLGFEGDMNNPEGNNNNYNNNYNQGSSSLYRQPSDLNSPYNYSYDAYDLDPITPQGSLYDIVLTRPRDSDDMDYVFDQVVQASNPVIVDLSDLKRNQAEEFKVAGAMLMDLRKQHNARVVLLDSNNKSLILIAPESIEIVKK